MAHLLIVDDDEQMVGALTRVFQQAGYTVSSELDAAGARARLQRERPDLVILDVMFPEDASAGFELARSIREIHPDMKDVPILMLTAVNTRFPPLGFGSQDINDTWLPVEDFVEKPVDMDVLKRKVEALLEKALKKAPPSSKGGGAL